MRVFVSCDMEGVAGVSRWSEVTGGDGYPEARELMTGEVNAVAAGAFEAGAESVIVCDAHWHGRNIEPERLDRRVELVRGDFRRLGMMEGIDDGADAAVFVGYHARAGASPAAMPHSFSGRTVFEIRVNGAVFGETTLNAALAGVFDVPVILVSGDRTVCEEARQALHEVETVVTKRPLSGGSFALERPESVRRALKDGVRAALARRAARVFKVDEPVEMEIVFTRPIFADAASMLPASRRTDAREVSLSAPSYMEAYMALRVMLALCAPLCR